MDYNELHSIANEARDNKVEQKYAAIIEQMYNAAKSGEYKIEIAAESIGEDLIRHLCRNRFIVYYRDKRNKQWHICNTESILPEHFVDQILIKW